MAFGLLLEGLMRVSSKKTEYLAKVFGVEDQELASVRQRLEASGKEGIAIGPAEARALQFLIRAFDLRRIVEIGTLYGYSTLVMAKALGEGGRIWTVEADAEHARSARSSFSQSGARDRIQLIEGTAPGALSSLESEAPFDLVFIDANKSAYVQYLDWAEAHLRSGGWIVGDNTFLFGSVYGEVTSGRVSASQISSMREFNLRLSDSRRFRSLLIPTDEGLTVAQKL